MLTSLVLGTVLLAPTAAPVPADAIPTPNGPAPQVAYLKADANGDVWVSGYKMQKQKGTRSQYVNENGKQVLKSVPFEQTVPVNFRQKLADLGGKMTAADGTELTPDVVARRVKDGAPVLISADGKPVEKGWLRAVRPDAVVIVSDALADAMIHPPAPAFPSTPAPRLLLLAADTDGRTRLGYNPNPQPNNGGLYADEQVIIQGNNVLVVRNRAVIVRGGGIEESYYRGPVGPLGGEFPAKPLEDIKFEAHELDGTPVTRENALRRLKAGGLVLIAGDARFPDAEYTKLFKGDLLVLVSAELALPPGAKVKPVSSGVQPRQLGGVAPANGPAVQQLQVKPQVAAPVGGLRIAPVGGLKVAPVQPVKPADEKKPDAGKKN